jgi:hypothetical protein
MTKGSVPLGMQFMDILFVAEPLMAPEKIFPTKDGV